MLISTTELRNNFQKYLDKIEKEDIIITLNGEKVAQLAKYQKEDEFAVKEDLSISIVFITINLKRLEESSA